MFLCFFFLGSKRNFVLILKQKFSVFKKLWNEYFFPNTVPLIISMLEPKVICFWHRSLSHCTDDSKLVWFYTGGKQYPLFGSSRIRVKVTMFWFLIVQLWDKLTQFRLSTLESAFWHQPALESYEELWLWP